MPSAAGSPAAGLYGPDRGDRVLHGRRLRVGAGPGRGFSAVSTNYGGCPKDAESWLDGACPIVGSYGGKDRSPMGASAGERLERTLTSLGVEHDIKSYPGVGHGFMNNHDPEDQTLMLVFLAKISGTRYDPQATADARHRILAMFDRALR